jgi:hypothetical protein
MAPGLLRLFMLQFREQLKYVEKNLPGLNQMAMQFMALGTLDELRRQLIDLSVARACLVEPWPRDAASFPRALCRGQAASRPAGAGDLPPGRADSRRLAVAAEETAGVQGFRGVRCRMSKDSSRA